MITNYPQNILCVDPGKLTGVVWLIVGNEKPIIGKAYETPGTMLHTVALFNNWANHPATVGSKMVICEDWDSRENDFVPDARLAIEPMAWLKMLASAADIPMVTQRPQTRLGISDSAVKRAGLWLEGGEGHMRQALRHGLIWLTTHYHKPTMMTLYPRTKVAQEL